MTSQAIDDEPDSTRRHLVVATAAVGGMAAVAASVPFVASLAPSARARASGAPVEADLSRLAPGELATIEWRGKPVWILHRTPEMIESLQRGTEWLLDPRSDRPQQPEYCRNALRSIKPEYWVALALCTHLGCIPTFRKEIAPADLGPDWPGGYYCPCHGSKFDFAGRVYKNVPAPLNLEIPEHAFISSSRLVIGMESESRTA